MKARTVFFVSVCLAIALASLLPSSTLAYATRTYSNFAGVTDAVALKDVWIVDSVNWNAHIKSYTTNPVYNIGTIGWTWWTHRETCNGNIVDNYTHSGYALYGASSVFDTGVDDRDACDGSHLGWSLGKHDFKHNGSEWRPEFSTSEGI